MAIYCPNCGVELPEGVAFCDACGTPLRGQNGAQAGQGFSPAPAAVPAQPASIGAVGCPVCGAAALPGEAFCDNCGTSLIAPTAYAHAPAPAGYSSTPMSGAGYAPTGGQTASLVVTSPPPPATIPIPDRPEMIVGRSDPQSNSYPDVDLGPYGGLELGVSRRHFRIKRDGSQIYVEDLGSMNGVTVNGRKVTPYTLHPLRSGDQIHLGKMELKFDLS